VFQERYLQALNDVCHCKQQMELEKLRRALEVFGAERRAESGCLHARWTTPMSAAPPKLLS